MDTATAYTINPARAISETLDGETIIINLVTGSYYSLNELGTVVWDHLRAGYTAPAIIDRLAGAYPSEQTQVQSAVTTCLTTLLADELIAAIPAHEPANLPLPALPAAFIAPTITKYDDMQEMLLADPIHDVDTSGWPTLK